VTGIEEKEALEGRDWKGIYFFFFYYGDARMINHAPLYTKKN
jgi:hypothetical protein